MSYQVFDLVSRQNECHQRVRRVSMLACQHANVLGRLICPLFFCILLEITMCLTVLYVSVLGPIYNEYLIYACLFCVNAEKDGILRCHV